MIHHYLSIILIVLINSKYQKNNPKFKIQGAPPLLDRSAGENFLARFNAQQDGFGSADSYEHVLLNCRYRL